MLVAVKDAGKAVTVVCDDIELRAGIVSHVDIRHNLKVFVKFIRK